MLRAGHERLGLAGLVEAVEGCLARIPREPVTTGVAEFLTGKGPPSSFPPESTIAWSPAGLAAVLLPHPNRI